jgi:CHAD domain-containing protein
MMSADLLDLPAPHAVRRIALGFLDDAGAAHARLMRNEDGEALHDFRVALRRLRSWLRADAWTGGDRPRKIAKRVRRIARATNAARDAEVLLDWTVAQRGDLTARERRALHWLADWLRARGGDADAAMQAALADFGELAPEWRDTLAIVQIEERVDEPEPMHPFRKHAGALVEARRAALSAAFAAIKGPKDKAGVHAARIEGKRLRYAIEPLANHVAGADEMIELMKTVQDDFGMACDREAFLRLLGKAARAAAKEAVRTEFAHALAADSNPRSRTASAVPGLVALARIAASEERAQYRRLRQRYLGTNGAQVLDPAHLLADRLGTQPAEIA